MKKTQQIIARYFLLIARYFLLVAYYFLLVARAKSNKQRAKSKCKGKRTVSKGSSYKSTNYNMHVFQDNLSVFKTNKNIQSIIDILPPSGQCAAVRTKCSDKIAPPQNEQLSCALPFLHCSKACHGQSPGLAIVPLTILLATSPLL